MALCYHVSARRLRIVPDDYAGCFRTLQEGEIIPPDHELNNPRRFSEAVAALQWK